MENLKDIAASIIKAHENNDADGVYGAALNLLKLADTIEGAAFQEGAKYVLAELAELYDGITDTDIWADYMSEENN